jgi:RimJ/RimL family protein N-acetyltransferase
MLKKHGVELVQLNETHLELLREWRNSKFVQQYMFNQKQINAGEQLVWFRSLSQKNEYHFLIKVKGDLIGSCNLKIASNRIAEGGIFVCSENFLGGLDVIKAIFIMYDWAFKELGVKSVEARIIHTNKRAIRFNCGIGFIVKSDDGDIVYATLDPKDFYKKYQKYCNVLG